MQSRDIAVIGAGFGDEGKGKVVSYFCSVLQNPLVIRYCGGQQAAHHVMIDDNLEHVFANFGSGTLQGVDTYWSQFCTVDPVGILNELEVLSTKKPITSKLIIDARCPVTTPYEKQYNLFLNTISGHGSCGVGIGATHEREENHYSLLMSDLLYPAILKIKLDLIGKYYKKVRGIIVSSEEVSFFLKSCEEILNLSIVKISEKLDLIYSNYIFEGSQGLLLDPQIGFFPHVTRSNTGTKNILEMEPNPEIFLVTRAYQTRHGNGPMTNEYMVQDKKIRENPYEKNFASEHQWVFRKTILDLDLLK